MSDVEPDRAVPRGHFAIVVDGYKLRRAGLFHVMALERGGHVSIPDAMVPPERHDTNSAEWWENAWVVGDNARDRLCKLHGYKPHRRFATFDEALQFGVARQRRFKTHEHTIIYLTECEYGRPQWFVVRSAEEAFAKDREINEQRMKLERLQSEIRAESERELPRRHQLLEHFNPSKAMTLSMLLARIRDEGADAVKTSMPASSWYRAMRDLRVAEIDPLSADQ